MAGWQREGQRVGFVPTMGALHEGHLSLVRIAAQQCERCVVSIFINPKQFAAHEDLDTYPRDEASDIEKLARLNTDLIYMPAVDSIYPPGFSTRVEVDGLTGVLCGKSRPHFFTGVATVVAKLLIQCLPDIAVFGEKDYQQLLVVRQMVRDLDIPVEIVGGPIIREEDGLAMSSRNAYLTKAERKLAPMLHATISRMAAAIGGGAGIREELAKARSDLTKAGFVIDYLEVRDAETLESVADAALRPARVFAAALLGKTRLIDNVPVPRSGG
ncbi:MAG: pantoate--beta-alanine ligase [Methyloligellaceae bacterium]